MNCYSRCMRRRLPSDSASSSSENESVVSASSSVSSRSESEEWSFAKPVDCGPASHYLTKLQGTLFRLVAALAAVIDGTEARVAGKGGRRRGWSTLKVEIHALLGLTRKWSRREGDDWKAVEVASAYAGELLQSLESPFEDDAYDASLCSEQFRARIVVIKRLWPKLRTTSLFVTAKQQSHALERVSDVSPTIISRLLAVSLRQPGSRYKVFRANEVEIADSIDLSSLGLTDASGALRFFCLRDARSILAGHDDLAVFLLNLSRNDLTYIPNRLAESCAQVVGLDVSYNPSLTALHPALAAALEGELRRKSTGLKFDYHALGYHSVPNGSRSPRGARALGHYAIARIRRSEADRLAALEHWAPLGSAYDCVGCDRLLIDGEHGYVAHEVVWCGRGRVRVGGRMCARCARGAAAAAQSDRRHAPCPGEGVAWNDQRWSVPGQSTTRIECSHQLYI